MEQEQSLIERLRKRAEIRRQIPGRKSVQEGKADRIAALLDEAATGLQEQEQKIELLEADAILYEHLVKLKNAIIIKLQKEVKNDNR
jgi:hypothetical protein